MHEGNRNTFDTLLPECIELLTDNSRVGTMQNLDDLARCGIGYNGGIVLWN